MNAPPRTATRADRKWLLCLVVWAALYFAARLVLELPDLGWWTRAAVAMIPVPAFAWVLVSLSRSIAQMDELERRIQLEALAFAFPMTLLLVMTLGLLELAIGLNPNDWSYRHVWPMLFIFYFGGLSRARRRYE